MLIHVVFSSLSILSDMVKQKAAQSLLYFRMFIFVTKNIDSISIFLSWQLSVTHCDCVKAEITWINPFI